jgi:hypothetical protein
VALVEYQEQLASVPGSVGQGTGLGLGQRGVEAGHEDDRVRLRQEPPGGRGIDLDGRPDPGGVDELEPEPEDLRRDLHLGRDDLLLGSVTLAWAMYPATWASGTSAPRPDARRRTIAFERLPYRTVVITDVIGSAPSADKGRRAAHSSAWSSPG